MSPVPVDMPGRIYEAIPGFEDHLEAELTMAMAEFSPISGTERYGPFLYHDLSFCSDSLPPFWFRNAWLKPFRLEFDSVSQAAGALRSIQRNWASSPFTCFRRTALITERLPPLAKKLRPFPWEVPAAPLGAWALTDEHTLVASAGCSSPFPGGVIEFEEDTSGPPSRAYLKLWEALTLAAAFARNRQPPIAFPGPGSRCLDAGASPGGWTWALRQLGVEVLAVDRSPLEERIAALPGVEYLRHDAFTLKPQDIGPLDWLFCDAAVYPLRLYQWIENWLASGLCTHFVCTLKMQGNCAGTATDTAVGTAANTAAVPVGSGRPDFDTPRRFAAIPGSRVVHLYHNKHELCWILA